MEKKKAPRAHAYAKSLCNFVIIILADYIIAQIPHKQW